MKFSDGPGLAGESSRALRAVDLGEMLYRSFFLQTLWNYQRMQNLGWMFSLWPALRRLYPDPKERIRAAMDHLEYFNTHPYFANLILGVVARLEEEQVQSGNVQSGNVLAAKNFMSGPLAALGDTLFWAVLRPLAGVVAGAVGWVFFEQSWWVSPVLFLIFFNAVHLPARAAGLWAGYRWKAQVVSTLMRLNIQKIVGYANFLGVVMATAALAHVWLFMGEGQIAAALIAGVGVLAVRRNMSVSYVFYGVMTAGFLYALTRGIFLNGFGAVS